MSASISQTTSKQQRQQQTELKFWTDFFAQTRIPSKVSMAYVKSMIDNRIDRTMLIDLNKELLNELGIKAVGDVIAVLKLAKKLAQLDSERETQASMAQSINSSPPKTAPKPMTISKTAIKPKSIKKTPEQPSTKVQTSKPKESVTKVDPISKEPSNVAKVATESAPEREIRPPPPIKLFVAHEDSNVTKTVASADSTEPGSSTSSIFARLGQRPLRGRLEPREPPVAATEVTSTTTNEPKDSISTQPISKPIVLSPGRAYTKEPTFTVSLNVPQPSTINRTITNTEEVMSTGMSTGTSSSVYNRLGKRPIGNEATVESTLSKLRRPTVVKPLMSVKDRLG